PWPRTCRVHSDRWRSAPRTIGLEEVFSRAMPRPARLARFPSGRRELRRARVVCLLARLSRRVDARGPGLERGPRGVCEIALAAGLVERVLAADRCKLLAAIEHGGGVFARVLGLREHDDDRRVRSAAAQAVLLEPPLERAARPPPHVGVGVARLLFEHR